MLVTYAGTTEKRIETNCIDSNWIGLKDELLAFTQYRIDSAQHQWYRDAYMGYMIDIYDFSPKRASEINSLPQGILGEVFFLNACKQNGIQCDPTFGEEDVLGADFKITNGKETRFFDVSVNTSERGFKKKVKEGTFPTLFIPWKAEDLQSGNRNMSYAERYMKYGTFDGKRFLHSILTSNYLVLDCIKRKVWRSQDTDRKLFNNDSVDVSAGGIQYIRSLEGVLILMRKSL